MMLNANRGRSLGTASADLHPLKPTSAKCWWINRVLVTHETQRGQGLGGRLLDTLLLEIVKQQGRTVIVTPGGYGGDPDLQIRFYENHDFIKTGEGATTHWQWVAEPNPLSNLGLRLAQAEAALEESPSSSL